MLNSKAPHASVYLPLVHSRAELCTRDAAVGAVSQCKLNILADISFSMPASLADREVLYPTQDPVALCRHSVYVISQHRQLLIYPCHQLGMLAAFEQAAISLWMLIDNASQHQEVLWASLEVDVARQLVHHMFIIFAALLTRDLPVLSSLSFKLSQFFKSEVMNM